MELIKLVHSKHGECQCGPDQLVEFEAKGWKRADAPEVEEPVEPKPYDFLQHDLEELEAMAAEVGLQPTDAWKRSDYAKALEESGWRPE